MSCTDCSASRETNGLWRQYDPLCLWCGVRLIQKLGELPRPTEEIVARRRAVLADWMKYGHSEQEIRALVKGPMALEPITKGRK